MPSRIAPEDLDISYEDKKSVCARVPFYWKDSIIQKARVYILKNKWNLDDIDNQPVVSSIGRKVIRSKLGTAKLNDEDIIARIVAVLEVTDNRVPLSWRYRVCDLPRKKRKPWLGAFLSDPSKSSLLRPHMKPCLLSEWAAKEAAKANGQVLEHPEAARWREQVRERVKERRENETRQHGEEGDSATGTEEGAEQDDEEEGQNCESETDYEEIEARLTSMKAGLWGREAQVIGQLVVGRLDAKLADGDGTERTGAEVDWWFFSKQTQEKQQEAVKEEEEHAESLLRP
ncbi:hypothetical protein QBC35DRAFT_447124 [Podospora australis]|uniref:Uncharacterized protein n=1 Tax=Podospora australis TaxID=1536484 RepID=A0AAN6X2L1_9PEZI|nr:hypothetical protein QBC35DRAFT_447124 [Podospora australis]